MVKKILFRARYFLVVVLIGILVITIFPTILSGGSAEQVRGFITRFYVQCLERQPDTAGLNEWAGRLISGYQTGADVATGFILSEEFKAKNHSNEEFVTILYRAFFNREPDASGFNIWLGKLSGGTSREAVLDGFLTSQEFVDLCNSYGIKPYAGASTATTTTATTAATAATATGSGYSSSGASG